MKFIYGDEKYYINKIVSKFKGNPSYNVIDLFDKTSIEETVEKIATISMFEQKNALVIRNSAGFKSDEAARRIVSALKYTDNEILFVFDGTPSKKTNPLYIYLLNEADYKRFDLPTPSKVEAFVKNRIDVLGGEIDAATFKYLVSKTPADLGIIENEIVKLLSCSKVITKKSIDEIFSELNVDNYFDFANAVISGNSVEIIKKYKNKVKFGIDPISIYNELSNLFSSALKAYILHYVSNKSEIEVANILKMHSFRVKKMFELLRNTSITVVKNNLKKLYELDQRIMKSSGDVSIFVERFILELIK